MDERDTSNRNAEKHLVNVYRSFIKFEKPALVRFYNDDTKLQEPAAAGVRMVEQLQKRGCSLEMAVRFSVLTLYDLVLLLDDSDTMVLEEDGERRENLKKVVREVVDIYSLARKRGIVSVRYFNTRIGKKNVTLDNEDFLSEVCYTGMSMIGTELQKKILDPFIHSIGPENSFKPLLVMIITDGEAEGEPPGYLKKVINNCVSKIQGDPNKGPNAVAFYFARIGGGKGAKKLIEDLDNDELLGSWIDCFPVDQRLEEVYAKENDVKWPALQKLLLGALYRELDENDDGIMFVDEEEDGLTVNPMRRDDEVGENLDKE